MTRTETDKSPVQQSVQVDCTLDEAFSLFTEGFAEWWPLALYSLEEEGADTCVIEPWLGGRVFERNRSGEEREWGSVIEWDPPTRLRIDWHPGGTSSESQTVDVSFDANANGTQVTVIHAGWSSPGLAVCALQGAKSAVWPALTKKFFVEFAESQMMAIA